jgi:uncharacterized protein YndB with AHSA1/START domain
MTANAAERTWSLDREIVLTRVFDAPRELVFEAWTKPEHAMKWFGPKGFTCTLHEMDVRVGGRWRFDMTAPDGKLYPNRIEYLEIVPNERLVFWHSSDIDNDPKRFYVTITFDMQQNNKTVVTLRQLHPSKAHRDAGIAFGAVELGMQTMDKLAEHLRTLR